MIILWVLFGWGLCYVLGWFLNVGKFGFSFSLCDKRMLHASSYSKIVLFNGGKSEEELKTEVQNGFMLLRILEKMHHSVSLGPSFLFSVSTPGSSFSCSCCVETGGSCIGRWSLLFILASDLFWEFTTGVWLRVSRKMAWALVVTSWLPAEHHLGIVLTPVKPLLLAALGEELNEKFPLQ